MTGTEAAKEKTSVLGIKGFPLKSWFHAWCHWNSSACHWLLCRYRAGKPRASVSKPAKVGTWALSLLQQGLLRLGGLQCAARSKDQKSITYSALSTRYLKVWRQGRLLSLQRKAGNQRFHKPLCCNYWGLNWCSERWAHQAGISQAVLTSEASQPQDLR